MSDETKRYVCCGIDWSEAIGLSGDWEGCPRCLKRFPAPAPEPSPSDDELLAWELTALVVADKEVRPWAEWHEDDQKDALVFLSRARALLIPAAYADGKRDGRREAYESVLAERDAVPSVGWSAFWSRIEEQRDACGPAKDADLDPVRRSVSELRAFGEYKAADVLCAWANERDRGPANAEQPSAVEPLTNDELQQVVATWKRRHPADISRDETWAMCNLACDVAQAQLAKMGTSESRDERIEELEKKLGDVFAVAADALLAIGKTAFASTVEEAVREIIGQLRARIAELERAKSNIEAERARASEAANRWRDRAEELTRECDANAKAAGELEDRLFKLVICSPNSCDFERPTAVEFAFRVLNEWGKAAGQLSEARSLANSNHQQRGHYTGTCEKCKRFSAIIFETADQPPAQPTTETKGPTP